MAAKRYEEEEEKDFEALESPHMRVPKMDAATARDLLDLGFSRPDQLAGRSPEAVFEDLRARRPDTPPERLYFLRMIIYYVETPEPDPRRLNPWDWAD